METTDGRNDSQTDLRTDPRADERTSRRADGRTEGRKDERTDRRTEGVAIIRLISNPNLKNEIKVFIGLEPTPPHPTTNPTQHPKLHPPPPHPIPTPPQPHPIPTPAQDPATHLKKRALSCNSFCPHRSPERSHQRRVMKV